jgi:hypothetical protein
MRGRKPDVDDLRQLRGAVGLATAVVDVVADRMEEAHHAMAKWPYTFVAWVPGAALPARAIAKVQHALTAAAYSGVRGVNRLVGAAASSALTHLEARAAEREE